MIFVNKMSKKMPRRHNTFTAEISHFPLFYSKAS